MQGWLLCIIFTGKYKVINKTCQSRFQNQTTKVVDTTITALYSSPKTTAGEERELLKNVTHNTNGYLSIVGDIDERNPSWESSFNARAQRFMKCAETNKWSIDLSPNPMCISRNVRSTRIYS